MIEDFVTFIWAAKENRWTLNHMTKIRYKNSLTFGHHKHQHYSDDSALLFVCQISCSPREYLMFNWLRHGSSICAEATDINAPRRNSMLYWAWKLAGHCCCSLVLWYPNVPHPGDLNSVEDSEIREGMQQENEMSHHIQKMYSQQSCAIIEEDIPGRKFI